METLYERLGGEAAMMEAVSRFYEKVLADARLGGYFEALDMDQQVTKQVAFMSWALAGPKEYRGRDLRSAHAALGLADVHFDAVAMHLAATLADLGVSEADADEALSVIAGTRNDVLGR